MAFESFDYVAEYRKCPVSHALGDLDDALLRCLHRRLAAGGHAWRGYQPVSRVGVAARRSPQKQSSGLEHR
jgi:hypothetical protein